MSHAYIYRLFSATALAYSISLPLMVIEDAWENVVAARPDMKGRSLIMQRSALTDQPTPLRMTS